MTTKPRGRPTKPASERLDYIIRVRVTADEKAKFERIGAAEWLRRVLKRAKQT